MTTTSIRYGSSGEAPTYRGELRDGACIKWQGEWRTRKRAAQDDADAELLRRTAPAAVIDQDSASQPGETFTVVLRGTLAECEAWVAAREKIEPENVHRGRYGIDADFGES